MARVSVIVPFLNPGPYLAEAIASVQAQTEADWELLLVDDGSTDASVAAAERAAAADTRIRVLRRSSASDGNAAAARNAGIGAATGELVAFLDADDVYEPIALESRRTAFTAHPEVMMVYGPTRWWHPDHPELDWTEDTHREAGRVHRPPSLLVRSILRQERHVPCTCGVMIHRAALEAVGGFDDRFSLYEDQTLWVKIMQRFPVYVTDVVGARYRQHPASATAASERSGHYDRLGPHAARVAFLRWVRSETEQAGPVDPAVARALRLASAAAGDEAVELSAMDRASVWVDGRRRAVRASVGKWRRSAVRFVRSSRR